MNHPAFRDPENLDPADRKTLFSYIVPVLDCSDRLLRDLEGCWQENIMLKNLSTHIYKHAEKHFQVYISYCEHQGRLDRTLKRLKETKPTFKDNLDVLENDPVCCGLNLHCKIFTCRLFFKLITEISFFSFSHASGKFSSESRRSLPC